MSRAYTDTRRKAPSKPVDASSRPKGYLTTFEHCCRVCGDACVLGSVKHLDRKLLSVWWYCDNPECENYSPDVEEEE